MYILNRPHKRSYGLAVAGLLLAGLAAGGYAMRGLLESDTVIGPAPAAVVRTVQDRQSAVKNFETAQFSFQLPNDWEPFRLASQPAGSQSWHNTAGNKGVRILTVYLNPAPGSVAVNRVLPVETANDRLSVAGSLSDNCTNFTAPSRQQTGQSVAVAKWQNVEFLCDTGNYTRNVVGIASPASDTNTAVGGVSLVGPTGGAQRVMITYTDHGPSPDYSALTSLVPTFRLK